MSATNRHALVLGASGVAGWAVVNELLEGYPAKGTFSKVTAAVNRPLKVEESGWPSPSDIDFRLISGVNLRDGGDLVDSIPDLHSVTHLYYFAYQQNDDPPTEISTNLTMLDGVIKSLAKHAVDFQFVVVPTGTRAYGYYVPGGVFKPPFREDMGRLPEPEGSKLFYYAMEDYLHKASSGQPWTWCEVRPDAIIGFTPNGSTFSLAAHWYNYLSLYAAVEGPGASIPYPGNLTAYKSLFNGASADIIARFSIYASLHPEQTGNGEIYNIADEDRPQSMEHIWPAVAGAFGLKGTPPVENQEPLLLRPSDYMAVHGHKQPAFSGSQLTKGNWIDDFGSWYTFDRPLALDKIRAVGFDEQRDAADAYVKTLKLFQAADNKGK
ncbi:hypothetical protein ASPWEDRAFT_60916 [Aspergillus wentii DTO 134E9]|uniref:PRISE-like Rossmann-fold domain-containing protein n=1 Tax=Aspergillus wentii DTO 134E9 TaxID=1073089 RepID=A0A1L9RI48_ASPWE|nr:uncharacterized protein ASPWEDRAFT_60916 [Aspergillus wentii DTO 134E9]KAI9925912.1 hypothetical protein MW887_005718 [Aspergillus wentii]OJJ34595.1 hypothetical protein ASPWEDRAFT_60916 [Aspergillus wentii DTO 134E9]